MPLRMGYREMDINLAFERTQIRRAVLIYRQHRACGLRRENFPALGDTRSQQNTHWSVAVGQINLRQDLAVRQVRFEPERDRSKCCWSTLDRDDLAVFEPAFRCGETQTQRVGLAIIIEVPILDEQ